MSYVERLVAGYHAGLACNGVPPTAEELTELLAESVDPTERGVLLGLLARVTADRDDDLVWDDEITSGPAPCDGLKHKGRAQQ